MTPYLEYKINWCPCVNGEYYTTWKYVNGPTGDLAVTTLQSNGGLNLAAYDVTALDSWRYNATISTVEISVGTSTYLQMPEVLQDVLADIVYASGSLAGC